MFITGSKEDGFKVHFNLTDMKDSLPPIVVGGNTLITLSAEKARELEDHLEELKLHQGE